MDKDKVKEFLEFCPEAADELLDVLTDMGLCTRTEPKKPSILEQEWHFHEDVSYCGGGQVYDADNNCVNFVKWKREIAALPDLTRAAVRLRTAKDITMHGVDLYDNAVKITTDISIWMTVVDAIKKAGIE